MAGWTVGDLEKPLLGTVLDGAVPLSLATATAVTAHIRKPDAAGTVINRAVVPAANQTTDPGEWSMVWQTGDLSVDGTYSVEIEVTWPGARPQTFPGAAFYVARQIA